MLNWKTANKTAKVVYPAYIWLSYTNYLQGSYRSSKTKFPDFPWLFQSITQHFPDLYQHKFQYWNCTTRTQ